MSDEKVRIFVLGAPAEVGAAADQITDQEWSDLTIYLRDVIFRREPIKRLFPGWIGKTFVYWGMDLSSNEGMNALAIQREYIKTAGEKANISELLEKLRAGGVDAEVNEEYIIPHESKEREMIKDAIFLIRKAVKKEREQIKCDIEAIFEKRVSEIR